MNKWQKIEHQILIKVGVNALHKIQRCLSILKEIRPIESDNQGPPYFIINDHRVPQIMEAICHSQHLAYNCLLDMGGRNTETSKMKNLRIERVSLVREKIDITTIQELSKRGFRNAVSHFDERFLGSLLKNEEWQILGNIALSHRNAIEFTFRPILIKVLYFDCNEMHLFDEHIKLDIMEKEIIHLIDKIQS
jgi:hypothetical protein